MRLLALLLLLPACSHFAYRSPGPYEGGSLLGRGSYLAEIWLNDVRFNAVFSRRSDATIFQAVAPSGKTLFRVRDVTGSAEPPEEQVFPTELALKKEDLEELYRAFRPLISLYDRPPSPQVTERYPDGRPRLIPSGDGLSLRIDEYDWDGHAFRLELAGHGWAARATLREYETAR